MGDLKAAQCQVPKTLVADLQKASAMAAAESMSTCTLGKEKCREQAMEKLKKSTGAKDVGDLNNMIEEGAKARAVEAYVACIKKNGEKKADICKQEAEAAFVKAGGGAKDF